MLRSRHFPTEKFLFRKNKTIDLCELIKTIAIYCVTFADNSPPLHSIV